jgi:hypothetical protein
MSPFYILIYRVKQKRNKAFILFPLFQKYEKFPEFKIIYRIQGSAKARKNIFNYEKQA